MNYVDTILEANETVTHNARVHWAVYIPAIILAAPSVTLFIATPEASVFMMFAFSSAVFFATLMAIMAFLRRRTTELAVTSKRVIVKVGIIRRTTAEINLNRIEGVNVDQSILGRMLGYGTIAVKGTGGGIAPVIQVDNPIAFRKAVQT